MRDWRDPSEEGRASHSLSVMIQMFRAIQYGSHQLHVAVECLTGNKWGETLGFFFFF